MSQFEQINTLIGHVDVARAQSRVVSLFGEMKDAFVVVFEIEDTNLVVTSIIGDSYGVIGYTNEEAEGLNFMKYLGLSQQEFYDIMKELSIKKRVLKLNKLKTKQGQFIETFGFIYLTTSTTLMEIVVPKTELLDLT
jgi:hypothetical protein